MSKEKPKLPKRFKAKFVKALGSGDYKQGKGSLMLQFGSETTYCCLGVAGKICGMPDNTLRGAGWITEDNYNVDSAREHKVPEILIGDNNSNPVVGELARFNDRGKSFKWIAAYIERYL